MLDLEAIRKRCEAATKGPWGSHEGSIGHGPLVHGLREHTFCRVNHRPENHGMFCSQDVRDGHFMAHARGDIPALLDEVEALTKVYHDMCGERFMFKRKYQAAMEEVERLRAERKDDDDNS